MARIPAPNTISNTWPINSSVKFSTGTLGGINCGNSSTINRSDQFSVSMWFKFPKELVAGNTYLMARASAWYIRRTANNYTIQVGIYNQVPTQIATTAITIENKPTDWHLLTITANTTEIKYYVDGAYVSTAAFTGTSFFQNTNPTVIGNWDTSTVGFTFIGNLCDVRYYSSVLTATEVSNLYLYNTVPSNCVSEWLVSGGTGTNIPDTVGSNTGTMTGGVWSRETPYKNRKPVYGNLVYNGDFEVAPPFTAATGTVSSYWIDGTAAGSATNDIFGWNITNVNNAAAKFDSSEKYSGSYSLKLSTLGTGAYSIASNTGGYSSLTAAQRLLAVPIKSSTSYTWSYKMKTNYVSGDATNGASVVFRQCAIDGSFLSFSIGTYVKTTTDWTTYSGTVTTDANAAYMEIEPRVYGHQGTATLIMDAWFDNIELKETSTISRSLMRPFGGSLRSNNTTDNLAIGSAALATAMNSAYTVSIWFKRARLGVVDGMFRDNSGDKFWFNFQTDGRLRVYHSDLTPASVTATNVPSSDMKWHHHVATYDGSTVKLYTDGVQVGSTSVTGTLTLSSDLKVPDSGAGALGSYGEIRVWSRALGAAEISTLYYSNIFSRTNLVREYLLNTNTGATAYDTSASAANATITGATHSIELPISNRTTVNNNLVNNGEFTNIPSSYTPQTANAWIDGTASGSTANPPKYKWRKYSSSVAQTCNFTSSNELQVTNAGGLSAYCWVGSDRNIAASDPSLATLWENDIPIRPSTSYTLTVRAKADFTPTTGQLSVNALTHSASGTSLTNNSASYNSITSTYQIFTKTFTTEATAQWISIVIKNGIVGLTATAGTLTIDYINLTPTTPEARSTA